MTDDKEVSTIQISTNPFILPFILIELYARISYLASDEKIRLHIS